MPLALKQLFHVARGSRPRRRVLAAAGLLLVLALCGALLWLRERPAAAVPAVLCPALPSPLEPAASAALAPRLRSLLPGGTAAEAPAAPLSFVCSLQRALSFHPLTVPAYLLQRFSGPFNTGWAPCNAGIASIPTRDRKAGQSQTESTAAAAATAAGSDSGEEDGGYVLLVRLCKQRAYGPTMTVINAMALAAQSWSPPLYAPSGKRVAWDPKLLALPHDEDEEEEEATAAAAEARSSHFGRQKNKKASRGPQTEWHAVDWLYRRAVVPEPSDRPVFNGLEDCRPFFFCGVLRAICGAVFDSISPSLQTQSMVLVDIFLPPRDTNGSGRSDYFLRYPLATVHSLRHLVGYAPGEVGTQKNWMPLVIRPAGAATDDQEQLYLVYSLVPLVVLHVKDPERGLVKEVPSGPAAPAGAAAAAASTAADDAARVLRSPSSPSFLLPSDAVKWRGSAPFVFCLDAEGRYALSLVHVLVSNGHYLHRFVVMDTRRTEEEEEEAEAASAAAAAASPSAGVSFRLSAYSDLFDVLNDPSQMQYLMGVTLHRDQRTLVLTFSVADKQIYVATVPRSTVLQGLSEHSDAEFRQTMARENLIA